MQLDIRCRPGVAVPRFNDVGIKRTLGQEGNIFAALGLNLIAGDFKHINKPVSYARALFLGISDAGQVIEKLDVSRPQVLVEALIVEVDIDDDFALGFGFAYRVMNGDTDLIFSTLGGVMAPGLGGALGSAFRTKSFSDPGDVFRPGAIADLGGSSNIIAQIQASEGNDAVNIVSAPHILTSDNEEAEIIVGENVPFVTSTSTDTSNINNTFNPKRMGSNIILKPLQKTWRATRF